MTTDEDQLVQEWLATGKARCDDRGSLVKTDTLEALPPHNCTERAAQRQRAEG